MPAWLLGLGVYAFAGLRTHTAAAPNLEPIETALASSFHFSWLLLLPPLIVSEAEIADAVARIDRACTALENSKSLKPAAEARR